MIRAFYEFPKPLRKKYFVIVQEDTTLDDTPCSIPDCQTNQDAQQYASAYDPEADMVVYECFCCGQWFCIDHIDKDDLCPSCAKLPKGIIEEVITFREELNR